jgi:hypothetical protein
VTNLTNQESYGALLSLDDDGHLRTLGPMRGHVESWTWVENADRTSAEIGDAQEVPWRLGDRRQLWNGNDVQYRIDVEREQLFVETKTQYFAGAHDIGSASATSADGTMERRAIPPLVATPATSTSKTACPPGLRVAPW